MRFLAWLVAVPVGILLVLFAVSNRAAVTVGLWPFTEGVTAPSFIVALVPFALGLLLGAALAGVGTVRARWRHRGAARKVRKMEEQMAEMRTRHPHSASTTPAITGPAPTTIDMPPHP